MDDSPSWLLLFERVTVALGRAGAVIAGAALWMMALVISLATLSRYLFNKPWTFTDELSGILLLSLFFLPMLYVLTLDRHVRVTLLFDKMPERSKELLLITNSFLAVLYAGFMFGEGIRLVRQLMFYNVQYMMLEIPEALGAVSIPIGTGLFGLGCAAVLARRVVALLIVRWRKA